MPRITALEYEQTTGETQATFSEGLTQYGRMTNMKRTLLHSLPAYHALMEWYPLFDTIKLFLGERLSVIFAHALSVESDCLVCTTFMRRILIDWGENPGKLELDEKGEVIVAFGRAIGQKGNRVPDELYKKVAGLFTPEQIVALTGFASLMIATNIINNVLEVDLDEYLYAYRTGQPLPEKDGKHGG
jgi:hypothetical protein